MRVTNHRFLHLAGPNTPRRRKDGATLCSVTSVTRPTNWQVTANGCPGCLRASRQPRPRRTGNGSNPAFRCADEQPDTTPYAPVRLAGRLGNHPIGVLVETRDPDSHGRALQGYGRLHDNGSRRHRGPTGGIPRRDQLHEGTLDGCLEVGCRCRQPRPRVRRPRRIDAADNQSAGQRHGKQDRRQCRSSTPPHRAFRRRITAIIESPAARATTITLATLSTSTG